MSPDQPLPIHLVPTKSDRELAAEFKQRFITLLEPITALLNEAQASEFMVIFNCERDPYGRARLVPILTKQF